MFDTRLGTHNKLVNQSTEILTTANSHDGNCSDHISKHLSYYLRWAKRLRATTMWRAWIIRSTDQRPKLFILCSTSKNVCFCWVFFHGTTMKLTKHGKLKKWRRQGEQFAGMRQILVISVKKQILRHTCPLLAIWNSFAQIRERNKIKKKLTGTRQVF